VTQCYVVRTLRVLFSAQCVHCVSCSVRSAYNACPVQCAVRTLRALFSAQYVHCVSCSVRCAYNACRQRPLDSVCYTFLCVEGQSVSL
jgi:hypothetical protein